MPPAHHATVIVPRAPPTSTAPAAPVPTPGLPAQQLRAPGCRGRGGSELSVRQGCSAINTRGRRRLRKQGWRWPAEVRAIKGGTGRRGGRSRRGGWGACSGSPWPPRRPAERHLSGEERRKAGGGPVSAPRPSQAPAVLRPRGTRRLRDPRAGSEGGCAPPRAWASPSAGGAGAPRSRSRRDSGRATAPSSVRALELRAGAPRPAPTRGRCAEGPLARSASPRSRRSPP